MPVNLCSLCQLFRFQQAVMSLQTAGFRKAFGNPTAFWAAYSLMPMNEKCPDGFVADLVESPRFTEIPWVFTDLSATRVKWRTRSMLRCFLQSLIYFESIFFCRQT